MDYKEKVIALLNNQKLSKEQKEKLESIFPELRESEDEKIRKWIIGVLSTYEHDRDLRDAAIAWLEKQGEQKHKIQPKFKIGDVIRFKGNETLKGEAETHKIVSYDNELYVFADGTTDLFCEQDLYELVEQKNTNKVEPKFKVGDWVVYDHRVYQVVELPKEGYINLSLRRNGKIEFAPSTYCRPWTIQDAKDGDVIAVTMYPEGTWIGIFKEYNGCTFSSYCFVNTEGTFKLGTYNHGNGKAIHPATKEQRDTLMKAMADAGYTFDFEKKELKKIVVPIFKIGDTIIKKHNSDILYFGSFTITDITGGKYWYNDRIICDITEQDEWEIYEPVRQKSTEWSEEDENLFKSCITRMQMVDSDATLIDWLVSIKNRFQPKQEWNEEDERCLTNAIVACKQMSDEDYDYSQGYIDAINWLKVLKDRVRPQPVQGWSNEDSVRLKRIIDFLRHNRKGDTDAIYQQEQDIDWLKSLEFQKKWKPSEKQLNALRDALSLRDIKYDVLYELLECLKKLK